MKKIDTKVKTHIYSHIAETTRVPGADEVAVELSFDVSDVKLAFERLQQQRTLVLKPGTHTIIMAPPFSAVKSPFRVDVGEKEYYGPCMFDGLGIAAALGADADIHTECADCNEPLTVEVRDGQPVAMDVIVHYAIPAARWWDDIEYT